MVSRVGNGNAKSWFGFRFVTGRDEGIDLYRYMKCSSISASILATVIRSPIPH